MKDEIFEHNDDENEDEGEEISIKDVEEQMGKMLGTGMSIAALGTAAQYIQEVGTTEQIDSLDGDKLKSLIDAQAKEQTAFLEKVKPLGLDAYVASAQILPLFIAVRAADAYLAEMK